MIIVRYYLDVLMIMLTVLMYLDYDFNFISYIIIIVNVVFIIKDIDYFHIQGYCIL